MCVLLILREKVWLTNVSRRLTHPTNRNNVNYGATMKDKLRYHTAPNNCRTIMNDNIADARDLLLDGLAVIDEYYTLYK